MFEEFFLSEVAGVNMLGFDTSTQNLSFCIVREGRIVVAYNRCLKFAASQLIPQLDRALKKVHMKISAFDAFFLGKGPGSFTGLRISHSIMKALVLATQKPAITVGSFFACAYAVREMGENIAIISDARRNLVYAAFFHSVGGTLRCTTKEHLTTVEKLKRYTNYLFVTSDAHLKDQMPKAHFYHHDIYPRADYLLIFARECFKKQKFTPREKLEPLYLHPNTCQVRKSAAIRE